MFSESLVRSTGHLKIYNEGVTHNGTFHADDVLSTCLLILLNPKFSYKRLNEVPASYSGIAYDIGGGKYDHHMEVKKRNNGKLYAAFGLIWKDYGSYFMKQENAELFDDVFVSEIDKCDTSSNTNLLSSSIEYFNPKWNSKIKSDVAFDYAVQTFLPILKGLIEHFKNSTFIPRFCKTLNPDIMIALENINEKQYCNKNRIYYDKVSDAWNLYYKNIFINDDNRLFEDTFISQVNKTYGKYKTSPFILGMSFIQRRKRIEILEEIILERIQSINSLLPARKECERIYKSSNRKDLLIFDRYLPYTSLSTDHDDVKGVVFPSERGGYSVLCIDMNEEEKQRIGLDLKARYKRVYFPVEIRGREKALLNKFSNGLIFVHPSGFIASCNELQDAINFFDKII